MRTRAGADRSPSTKVNMPPSTPTPTLTSNINLMIITDEIYIPPLLQPCPRAAFCFDLRLLRICIRLLEYQLSFVRSCTGSLCCIRQPGVAVVSQDHSAVLVSTVRLEVQFRWSKATGPPQELEVGAQSTPYF